MFPTLGPFWRGVGGGPFFLSAGSFHHMQSIVLSEEEHFSFTIAIDIRRLYSRAVMTWQANPFGRAADPNISFFDP